MGTGLGAIRAIWRVQTLASRRRGSTRGRCTRRGGLTAARGNSGEQLCVNQCSTQGNRGAGRLLTLRGSAGGTGQRRRHKDATGRRWRSSSCARTTPVSTDWTHQRGGGHTEGCPEKLTARRSSLWHYTGRGRNGGHGTGEGRRRAVAEVLCSRGQSERESERAGQRAQMEEGRWASRARVQKGRGGSVMAGERTDVGASTAGRSWARG